MTNNIDLNSLGAPDVTYKVPDTFVMVHHPDGTSEVVGEPEVLPWSTAHLKCACGHAWDDHKDRGCNVCNCLA